MKYIIKIQANNFFKNKSLLIKYQKQFAVVVDYLH